MKNSLVHPGSLLSARAGASRLATLMSARQRTVVRSASAALAIAVCGGLAGCGVPSVADGTGTFADGDCFAVTYSDSVSHSDPDTASHPYADAVADSDDAGPDPGALDAA